jgi:arginine/lysine/ornithine decarboxylase
MDKPVCEVLLLSADLEHCCRWMAELSDSALGDLEAAEFSLRFSVEDSPASALARVGSDGNVQAVILDAGSVDETESLADSISALRPELNLFIAVAPGQSFPDLEVELLDRHDEHLPHIYRQVRTAIARRVATPFADTLKDYIGSARDAWHTPGHSGGDSLRGSPWVDDFYQMMGEHIFNADLSVSVQVLDSLLEPHGVIEQAQDLAAEAFGADQTFFVTNGTSTANKVIVQHLLGAGGKLILDQACHKSLHHAVILSGVQPVYLNASLKAEFGFYGPVTKADIFSAIDTHPDARLLVLTSCTYDGFYYDLAPIIDYAHAQGIKVLIDEAWYAHGRFHPALRPNALECGADYVTQSTHKMLSAFSQASMIHVADPDFDEHRFREDLNMHTSTSPQYAMIASLDVARKQMVMEGFARLSRCIDFATRLRERINNSGVFRVLELADMLPAELCEDGIRLDPTKLSIDVSGSGVTARELQLELFESYGIQIEKATHNTVSVLVTLGSTEGKLLRLINAFSKLADRYGRKKSLPPRTLSQLPALSEFTELPRTAYFGASCELPLLDQQHQLNAQLLGAVSADLVVPYPPGIPVLIPGQRISREIVSYLLGLLSSNPNAEIHGAIRRSEELFLRVTEGGEQGAGEITATAK